MRRVIRESESILELETSKMADIKPAGHDIDPARSQLAKSEALLEQMAANSGGTLKRNNVGQLVLVHDHEQQ